MAVDDDKFPANPCRIRGYGKEVVPERLVAMPEQMLAIADSIDGQYRALVILGAWCSLRFGKLAGLSRSGVDLLHRKIHVVELLVEPAGGKTVFKSPKTESGRTVDVPAELVSILEDHLAQMSVARLTPSCSRAQRAPDYGGRSSGPGGRRHVARSE